MSGKYKPVGWRGEPHRHYLAAKGIKTNRRYMAYQPTYTGADLPLIAGDAAGTAGAAAVSLIPLAVTAGALYVGARGIKRKSEGESFFYQKGGELKQLQKIPENPKIHWKVDPYSYYQEMSADQYLRRSGDIRGDLMGDTYWDIADEESRPMTWLSGRMLEGETIQAPYVYGWSNAEHEGRHRMMAAEMIGKDKVPVKTARPDEQKTDEIFEEFWERSGFMGPGYKREWKERFRRPDPMDKMGTKHKKIYADILRERGFSVTGQVDASSGEVYMARQGIHEIPIDEAFEMRRRGSVTRSMEPKRPEKTMKRLETSMRKKGFIEPIPASKEEFDEGRLQEGKHRLITAKKLGMKTVPVDVQ